MFVTLLESVGFMILIDYYCNLNLILRKDEYDVNGEKLTKKDIVKLILLSILAFYIIVTLVYHPFEMDNPMPFLSHVSTFGLFLYVYADLF